MAETAERMASMREAMVETAVWRDLKWPTTGGREKKVEFF